MDAKRYFVLYFSGTGNTAYIAKRMAANLGVACQSIENRAFDFAAACAQSDVILVLYPCYVSGAPRLMRRFAAEHKEMFRGKQLAIFCTQALVSGDAARAFLDLFPPNWFSVVYTDHFIMPNNICNLPHCHWTFSRPIVALEKRHAARRVDRVCKNLLRGKTRLKGFGALSRKMGNAQRKHQEKAEQKAMTNIRVSAACTGCGACAKVCPAQNFAIESGRAQPRGRCEFCFRCLNLCPQKAITALGHHPVIRQYRGIETNTGKSPCRDLTV